MVPVLLEFRFRFPLGNSHASQFVWLDAVKESINISFNKGMKHTKLSHLTTSSTRLSNTKQISNIITCYQEIEKS